MSLRPEDQQFVDEVEIAKQAFIGLDNSGIADNLWHLAQDEEISRAVDVAERWHLMLEEMGEATVGNSEIRDCIAKLRKTVGIHLSNLIGMRKAQIKNM
jgi:hypothetical protein